MVQLLLSRSSSHEALHNFLNINDPPWIQSHALKPSKSLPALAGLSFLSDKPGSLPTSQALPVWPARKSPKLLSEIHPSKPQHGIQERREDRQLLQSSFEEEGSWTYVEIKEIQNQDARRVYNAYMSRVIDQ
uniref:Uncharacterized protein n=1 Tax=Hanusia phi TaxID=3032 RepID=A0A7S0F2Y3_9CRYP|mmetsp:Transcript_3783/g.9347  ORF Transcript_3783/g.9347 Transcript_3783/m.9347 type:complete len:132 (+) Transcript_3783:197-592(+)|eukprot:763267-Hanusia_phi.AAC.2